MTILIKHVDQSQIDLIKPLWNQLIEHHKARTRHFQARYAAASFEKRKQGLFQKAGSFPLNIDLAYREGAIIGYCVSSITNDLKGEIDSLLVDSNWRGYGIGDVLVQQACLWMDQNEVLRKVISVGEGNEEVFSFYRRYRFYPLANTLVQVGPAPCSPVSLPGIKLVSGTASDMELIRSLWTKLTQYDGEITPLFKNHFRSRSFTVRKNTILNKAEDGELLFDLVYPERGKKPAGYCVSTISSDKKGKIESIYLEPGYRSQGLGRLLMQRALEWMDSRGVEHRMLMAAAGNSRAIKFYAGFNFFPADTILQQI